MFVLTLHIAQLHLQTEYYRRYMIKNNDVADSWSHVHDYEIVDHF